MKNQDLNPLYKRQDKDTNFKAQTTSFFEYLQTKTATASMVSTAIGIPQKNICRYKRTLQKEGRLWQVEKKNCKETGFKAWYLTTNSENAPNLPIQLSLFTDCSW